MKNKPFSVQVDLDAFNPATESEKEYMVKMRPSSTFLKDGIKRLLKNKIATISFFVVGIIALASIILPMVWPYSYEQQLGITPGKPVDGSYKNLAPFEYGETELERIEAGESGDIVLRYNIDDDSEFYGTAKDVLHIIVNDTEATYPLSSAFLPLYI